MPYGYTAADDMQTIWNKLVTHALVIHAIHADNFLQ